MGKDRHRVLRRVFFFEMLVDSQKIAIDSQNTQLIETLVSGKHASLFICDQFAGEIEN